MAVATALKSIDSLSGVDAKMAALERLERLFDQTASQNERHKSNIALKRAVRIWRRGDITDGAAPSAPRSWGVLSAIAPKGGSESGVGFRITLPP